MVYMAEAPVSWANLASVRSVTPIAYDTLSDCTRPPLGKSCFIAYAVVERLRKEQPVAVQVQPENSAESYVLFSEKGVSLHSGYSEDPLRSYQGIWAFSDSSPYVNVPAVAFLNADVKVFQTTSPKISRWKEWTKQKMIRCYIIDVWPPEEISALACVKFIRTHCTRCLT